MLPQGTPEPSPQSSEEPIHWSPTPPRTSAAQKVQPPSQRLPHEPRSTARSQPVDAIEFDTADPLEPPGQQEPKACSQAADLTEPPLRPISASEKRLAAIRIALESPSSSMTDSEKRLFAIRRALQQGCSPTPSTNVGGVKRAPSADGEPGNPCKRPKIGSKIGVSPPLSITPTVYKSGRVGKVSPVFLSSEQLSILNLVCEGTSLFFTGSAGTGKSVLLREIIKTLRKKHSSSPDAVAVTASTGIAACNVGGVTVHSFGGVRNQDKDLKDLLKEIRRNPKAKERWTQTKVLIIDEVSMIDGRFFDKLSQAAKKIRKSQRPFGGIQIVVTGDFFQLPPVVSQEDTPVFCFESAEWGATIKHTYSLTQVFRQKDQRFVDMLNEMRFGSLSPESIAEFHGLSRPLHFEDGVEPTELFPTRREVEGANMRRLQGLSGKRVVYTSVDSGNAPEAVRTKIFGSMLAPQLLEICVGAQVMLIKNMDETLVNGSLGRVTHYEPPPEGSRSRYRDDCYPVVEFLQSSGERRRVLMVRESFKFEAPNGEVQACRSQVPLILAWAISIHKSQGQTLDRVRVDLRRTFEKGQAYVALSRATSLQGLQVLGFDADKVQAHPKVVSWNQGLSVPREEGSRSKKSKTQAKATK